MTTFPSPDATFAEVRDWYAKHGIYPMRKPFIPFAGQNCEDECEGWDGHSRRCQCGNRRVYWDESDGMRFARAD